MHRKYYHYLLFIAHPIHRHSIKAFKKQSKYVVSCYLRQDTANVHATSWGECLPKWLQGRALRVTDAERREDKEMVKEICGERCTAEPETHTLSWVPPPSPPFLYTKLSPAHRQNTHMCENITHPFTPCSIMNIGHGSIAVFHNTTNRTGLGCWTGFLTTTYLCNHTSWWFAVHARTHTCMHAPTMAYISQWITQHIVIELNTRNAIHYQ